MKQFLLLCALMFTTPLLGSGIDAGETSAPCDNATLETYGGTANVEINWEPNTIQTRWYNGNTLVDTTNTNADSCVYDDVLNVPPNPTRTGYTFNGWTVRPEMDFSTISKDESGTGFWAKGISEGTYFCYHVQNIGGPEECKTDSNYDELQQGEWKVKFSNGTLYGMSGCSITSGNFAGQIGIPSIELGGVCWCKATGWRAAGTNIISAPMYAMSWVYVYDNRNYGRCMTICAHDCGVMINTHYPARAAVLTLANN